MTGIAKGDRYSLHDWKWPVVIDADELPHGFFGIRRGIERLDWRQTVFGSLLRHECRIVSLDFCRILEHDAGQVARREGAINISVEALPAKVRQVAGMVDMGMTEHHRFQLVRLEGKLPVALDGFGSFS